jgi:DeoR/GlpR family transcriptional regulator of sugar metabolism
MMPNRIKVKNERLVRDTKTGAILSTDHDSIHAYERRKHEHLAQKERINKLEQELFDLKSLVSKLIEKR